MSNTEKPPEKTSPEQEHLEALVTRARQGDESVLPELRQHLDRHPQVWQTCGNLAAHAQAAWLNLVGGADLVIKESVRRQLDQRQQELAGPRPTALESLLVQRVLAALVQVNYIDIIYARAQSSNVTDVLLHELQRRQESAGRCLTEAVKQLELARRLGKGKNTPIRLAKLDLSEEVASRH
jgi:hypothetical protein